MLALAGWGEATEEHYPASSAHHELDCVLLLRCSWGLSALPHSRLTHFQPAPLHNSAAAADSGAPLGVANL